MYFEKYHTILVGAAKPLPTAQKLSPAAVQGYRCVCWRIFYLTKPKGRGIVYACFSILSFQAHVNSCQIFLSVI